jgi:RNA polymerase sigma-70 factor (sigma-E family)
MSGIVLPIKTDVSDRSIPAASQTADTAADTRDAAFEDVFHAARDRLVRLAYLLTDSLPTAEEVVQDAFIGLLRAWDSVHEPHGYLRVAVVNGARNHLRRREVARRGMPKLVDRSVVVVDPADADGAVLAALVRLPERQRTAVVLRYWGDWPEAEIATALGCRPGTVKSLLSRALNELRKEAISWT